MKRLKQVLTDLNYYVNKNVALNDNVGLELLALGIFGSISIRCRFVTVIFIDIHFACLLEAAVMARPFEDKVYVFNSVYINN